MTFVTDVSHERYRSGRYIPAQRPSVKQVPAADKTCSAVLASRSKGNGSMPQSQTQNEQLPASFRPAPTPIPESQIPLKDCPYEPNDRQCFPLTYYNNIRSTYDHPSTVYRGQAQDADIPYDPEWHPHCSFDNIAHGRPEPKEVASSSSECYCYARQHGIILLNKTLTHGEGAP